jgi:hypothetical protein
VKGVIMSEKKKKPISQSVVTKGFKQKFFKKPSHPEHRGAPVKVGEFKVYLGGTRDLRAEDLERADILIPLLNSLPEMAFGKEYRVLAAPLVDYGGVPLGWEKFLRGKVIPLLESGTRILAFCMGSHGRTGCFLASLIAILESPEETPDPIVAARKRHCHKAVESLAQAEAIFALRGEELPDKYVREFIKKAQARTTKGNFYGAYFADF